MDAEPILSNFEDNAVDLDKLNEGVYFLVYGMIGWLSVITLASLIVFVVINTKLSRAASELDDAEAGPISSAARPKSARSTRLRRRKRTSPFLDPPGSGSMPSFIDYDFTAGDSASIPSNDDCQGRDGSMNCRLRSDVASRSAEMSNCEVHT